MDRERKFIEIVTADLLVSFRRLGLRDEELHIVEALLRRYYKERKLFFIGMLDALQVESTLRLYGHGEESDQAGGVENLLIHSLKMEDIANGSTFLTAFRRMILTAIENVMYEALFTKGNEAIVKCLVKFYRMERVEGRRPDRIFIPEMLMPEVNAYDKTLVEKTFDALTFEEEFQMVCADVTGSSCAAL